MKRWIVNTLPMNKEVVVTADTFRVIEGALYFCNSDGTTYPEVVKVFARGQWLEIAPAPPEETA